MQVKDPDYHSVEIILKEALRIREDLFGSSSKVLLPTLNNLAALYMRMGLNGQRIEIEKRIIAIRAAS